MKRHIVCFCEHSFEADIPIAVDLSQEPEVEQAIIDGDFLNVRCPNCGKVLKPEFPVLIEDPQAENSIFFVPELDRGMYFRGSLSYSLREANRGARPSRGRRAADTVRALRCIPGGSLHVHPREACFGWICSRAASGSIPWAFRDR